MILIMKKNPFLRPLLAGLAAGCFLAGNALTAAEPLKIWISSLQDKLYYEDMIKLYQEQENPDFKAEIQSFGFREMPDKLAVAIKTGANTPDIVQLDEVLFGSYLNGEVPFVELSEKIKAAGMDESIVEQRLKLFAYKGKTYGVPQSLSAMVLYYRRDLFEKYNITPADIATWDDFVKVGHDLRAKNQPFIALDPTYFDILLRQRGSDLADADGNLFPDEEKAKEVLQFLHELNYDGIGMLPERASVFDPIFFSSSVANDEVLCIIGADWYGLDMIQQFSPELSGSWGAMPLPAWQDKNGVAGRRTSTFAGQGLLIYKESKEVDASWDFINFVMTNREANVRRFVNGNSFPAHKPSWQDERMQQPNAYFSGQRFGKLFMDLSPEVPEVVMNPKRPMAIFLFQENIFSSVAYGQLSPEQAIQQMRDLLKN